MYTVELKGFEELQRRMEREADGGVRRELEEAMRKSVHVVEGEVRPRTPVGVSSRLRNSINGKVEAGLGGVVGRVGTSLSDKEVYPAVMEFGRKPRSRKPPTERLVRWVHLQLGVPMEAAWLVARGLAKKIGVFGIKEKRMFREGWEASEERVRGFFEEAVEAIAEL